MSVILIFICIASACLAVACWLLKPEPKAKHRTVDFKHTGDTRQSNSSDSGSDDTEWTSYLERL